MVRELEVALRRDRSAAKERETGTRRVNRLRRAGRVPGVLYGGDLKAPVLLTVSQHDFRLAVQAHERVLTLKLPAGPVQALVKALQYDAVGEELLHADFVALRAGEKVRVRVPVVTKGVPKGHVDGGVLNQPLHSIEVECMPAAIPERIVADVEPLGLNAALHVSDLKLPEGVVSLTRPTDVVAACMEPRKEEVVAATPAEGAPLEPEVLAEKKKEEGEGAEGEAAAGEEKKPAAKAEKKEGK